MSTYDEMLAAGWHFHRNGSSGCGFYTRIRDGKLVVRFHRFHDELATTDDAVPYDNGYRLDDERAIALSMLDLFTDTPVREHTRHPGRGFDDGRNAVHVSTLADGDYSIVIWEWNGGFDENARYVSLVVGNGRSDDGALCASFNMAQAIGGDVRNCYNSHRGDVLLDEIDRWIDMPVSA